MRHLLNFAFLLLSVLSLRAQQQHEQTNAGTDFWVTDVVASYDVDVQMEQLGNDIGLYDPYMESYFVEHLYEPDDYADTAYIQVVGHTQCNGYVENPNTGWRYDFVVDPNHITEIKVPEEEIMCYFSPQPQAKGVYVHTDCEVYAYLITRKSRHWQEPWNARLSSVPQKFQIPPVQTGREEFILPFIVLGLKTTGFDSQGCEHFPFIEIQTKSLSQSYLVVAHEDNTEVTIEGHFEATALMSGNTRPEDIIWIPEQTHTLQRGEVLVIPRISSAQGPIFFMGTPYEVQVGIHTNCKKVSVFQHRTLWGWFNLMEAVAPFHPDLLGKDFLTLYSKYNKISGNLCSVYRDNGEDSPLLSHNIAYATSQLSGSTTAIEENTVCYRPPFTYRYTSHVEEFNGLPRYIYSRNPLMGGESAVARSPGHNLIYRSTPVLQLPYADNQVKEAIFPIQRYDYIGEQALAVYISTSPEGRYTTYVNGQLIPDTAFVIDDPQLGRYYITELIYREDIPEIVKIENEKGFSAYMLEVRPYIQNSNSVEAYCIVYNSGCTYDIPRPNIGTGVTTFCANDTLRVYTEGNGENYPITWIIEDSTFTSFDNDTILFPLFSVDTLHFTMIVEKYCPDTLIDTLYVVMHPHITLCADTLICRGASITAQCDMFGFWQWSDGTASATFTPQEEGDYTVRIDNDCGSDSATIHVRFYDDPLYVDFGNDTLLCELSTLLLDATQQHPASYLWQDASINTTYTVIKDGRYWVVVTDDCAGTSDTIDVTYLHDLRLNLGPDTTFCSDRPYQLDVSRPFSHYLWHDGTTAPTHWVDAPGTYSVHVYNICTEADASVTVEMEECEETVHVPNAFTPDGDGLNDLFLPVFNHPERVESYTFQIYDR